MDKMVDSTKLTMLDINSLIPRCLINTNEDDLSKLVFFYIDISNKFRNVQGVTEDKLIKLIAFDIIKERKGDINNINLYLLIGLKNVTIQHVELSRASIIQILLNETAESKRMDKVNAIIANINNNLPIGLRDLFSLELKTEISANLMNVEAFGNCEGIKIEGLNPTLNNIKTKLHNLANSKKFNQLDDYINSEIDSVDYTNYIDTEEDYAIGLDGTLYYYNPIDGTIFKLTDEDIKGTSPNILNKIYKNSKITAQNINNAICKSSTPTITPPITPNTTEYEGKIMGMTKGEFALMLILIIILICIIAIVIYYLIIHQSARK